MCTHKQPSLLPAHTFTNHSVNFFKTCFVLRKMCNLKLENEIPVWLSNSRLQFKNVLFSFSLDIATKEK